MPSVPLQQEALSLTSQQPSLTRPALYPLTADTQRTSSLTRFLYLTYASLHNFVQADQGVVFGECQPRTAARSLPAANTLARTAAHRRAHTANTPQTLDTALTHSPARCSDSVKGKQTLRQIRLRHSLPATPANADLAGRSGTRPLRELHFSFNIQDAPFPVAYLRKLVCVVALLVRISEAQLLLPPLLRSPGV